MIFSETDLIDFSEMGFIANDRGANSLKNRVQPNRLKFLEHEFFQLASEASRAIIVNKSIPTRSSVSEYDEAMLREFIENTIA